jgi:hypothetical protein
LLRAVFVPAVFVRAAFLPTFFFAVDFPAMRVSVRLILKAAPVSAPAPMPESDPRVDHAGVRHPESLATARSKPIIRASFLQVRDIVGPAPPIPESAFA